MTKFDKYNPNTVKFDFPNFIIDQRRSLTELAEMLEVSQQSLNYQAKKGKVTMKALRRMEAVFGTLEKYIIRRSVA